MDLENAYFYTSTILNWKHLLSDDRYKDITLSSLEYLVRTNKMRVYAFVIMPNHFHAIFRNLEMNGKEFPEESFLKFTAHEFKKALNNSDILSTFLVNKIDRKYQFWQRRPLPIEILSIEMLEQKLDYIHENPLQIHWNLVSEPAEYLYSSASFYELGDPRYPWLTDYREDF
jgi:putative transposase